MSYGKKIAELRKRRGMTQADLGKELNVTYQAVSKWERDESEPDFATMSKMAKIFGVGLSYFEEEDGSAPAPAPTPPPESAPTPPPAPASRMLGVCKECGKAIYEGDDAQTDPDGKLICAECVRKQAAKRAQAEQELQARRERYAEDVRTDRRRGFLWGTVATVATLAIAILAMCYAAPEDLGATIGGGLVVTALMFFTVTQLFWDGAVATVAGIGGQIVGTPGVIFSFDLDGFIFLIAMKILFALIRMFIFVVTFLFFVLIAAVISPFTFVPCLMRINGEIAGRLSGEIALPSGRGRATPRKSDEDND